MVMTAIKHVDIVKMEQIVTVLLGNAPKDVKNIGMESVHNACHCKFLTFLTQLYTLDNLKLFIDSFSQLVELLFIRHRYWYVKIRPRLLSECLNSAAYSMIFLYIKI